MRAFKKARAIRFGEEDLAEIVQADEVAPEQLSPGEETVEQTHEQGQKDDDADHGEGGRDEKSYPEPLDRSLIQHRDYPGVRDLGEKRRGIAAAAPLVERIAYFFLKGS
jgi:hypothetical protein